MSYYFNNGGIIWSDIKYTVNTRQVEDVYSYKTLLDPDSTKGISYYTPSFYIKDGSTPWFDSHWDKNGEITAFDASKAVITAFDVRYMCVGRFTISSLSSKYTLPNDFSNYYIPSNTTPELYKFDVYKNENGVFKNEFNSVDLNKGGKVYWRIPTEQYGYFTFNDYGNLKTLIQDNKMALHYSFRDDNFINYGCFVYYGENTNNYFSPSVGNFIKSQPNYYSTNKFGFTLDTDSKLNENEYAPQCFNLVKSKIPSNYTKLKIKMDAIVVHGNNSFGEPYSVESYVDDKAINTYGGFSADDTTDKTPFCFSLFYASNNDATWSIPASQISDKHPYIGDGEVFSNLKTNGNSKPLVKDKNHYKIRYIKHNNSEGKEVQEWTNKHVWSHFRPLYLTTGWHKMYPGVVNVTSSCTAKETCPICGDGAYRGAAGPGSMKCDYATLTYFPLCNPDENRYYSPSDFPVPYYRKDEYDSPVSASAVYNWKDGMNCCGGKGYVYKYFIKNNNLYRSSKTATCPLCTNNGESLGKGWNWCRCVDTKYKDIWTTSCEDDFGTVFENYKLQMNPVQSGYVNCTRCAYTAENSTSAYRPYKNYHVTYKFKFCTKTSSFNGYIFDDVYESISLASKYIEVASMDEVKPENIPEGKLGVYCHSDTTENEFPDYDNLITKDWFSGFSDNVSSVSSNWFIYVKDTYTDGTYNYYYQSNNNNSSPGIRGAGHSMTDPYSAVWYMGTSSTNTTVTDSFGNTTTMGKWNPTGNTPDCACNFTIANVQLNYDINLSECTGDYIHIAYPYTTIFNYCQTDPSTFIIPQISMSYEAE